MWLDIQYLIMAISKGSVLAPLLYIYNNTTIRQDGDIRTIWETELYGLLKYIQQTHTPPCNHILYVFP